MGGRDQGGFGNSIIVDISITLVSMVLISIVFHLSSPVCLQENAILKNCFVCSRTDNRQMTAAKSTNGSFSFSFM